MAFGLNRVELIGRLGADVTVNQLMSGGRVANLSIATDESYINRQTGDKVDKTEWHRVVTFQDGLIDMFVKHATKGRLVYIDGKLQTRRWSKPDEDGDRFSTEILLVPGGRVQFLDKPNGNGAPAQADPAMAGDTGAGRPRRRATPAPPLRPISTTGPKFRSSDRSSSFRFLPPHLAGTSVPAFFSAADPERDPFGRRARAMRGAPALLRRPERRPAGIGRPARIGRSPACSTNRLPPPASPPRSAPTPKPSAGAISRTAASTAATGWREISTAPAGGRSSSASAVPGSPASGPTPRPGSTATCSTSSAIAPARRRCARRSTRRGPSSPWSLPRTAIRGLRRPRAAAATTTRPKRRAACGGNAAPSPAAMPSAICMLAGSSRCRFAALRFHPELRYREGSTVRRFPALVAAVTGNDGAIIGVQRTWLDPRAPAKAGVASPRKALGRIFGHAVRFGAVPADGLASLVVGEGIETVLSLITPPCRKSAPRRRSPPAASARSRRRPASRASSSRGTTIRTARLAAERLARRCARAGVAATVIVPVGNDFNDDLISLGAPALRARLAPLVRFAGRRGERSAG